MMETTQITCPQCHKTFEQILNVKGRAFMTLCPYCEHPIKVGFKPKPIRLDLGGANGKVGEAPKMAQATMAQQIHESLNPKEQSEDTTTLGDLMKNMGKPMLMFDNKPYMLALGTNMVGRKSETSQATLQLPTGDRYMSRVNARIDVSRTVKGSWHVTISSVNERNLAKVNGRPVGMNDKFVLMNGQVITLGHSDLYFCLK